MNDSKHINHPSADQGLLLTDKTTVPKALYDSIHQEITEIVPALIPDFDYMAKILCGTEFWNSLEKGERIMAGKCLAYMVYQGLLPLKFAGKTKTNALRYQLK